MDICILFTAIFLSLSILHLTVMYIFIVFLCYFYFAINNTLPILKQSVQVIYTSSTTK